MVVTGDVKKVLSEQFPEESFEAFVDERSLVHLSGEISSWQRLIDIGHAAAKIPGVRNVISEMTAKGVRVKKPDYEGFCAKGREIGVIDTADVVVIGAGIIGCAIARELSKYNVKVIVVERGDDVSFGSSKSNNGMIHHGMDCKPGTLKARLNVLGNRRYDDWERELHIHLTRIGTLELVTRMEDLPKLYERFEKGLKNGVDGIRIVNAQQAYEIEPGLKAEGIEVLAGLHLPSTGVVETPYVCVALAENAAKNHVRFLFNHFVGDIELEGNRIKSVVTDKGLIHTAYVVNAAGMYADDIAKMAGDQLYTIHNRRGTIAIMDKATPPTFRNNFVIVSGRDTKGKNTESKGGGMHPTPENNLLVGPSAEEVPDKEDTRTSYEGMDYVYRSNMADPHNPKSHIIKIFGGARPADFKEDFCIEKSEVTDGFFHAACTQSPGVASAPAVADYIIEMLIDDMKARGKEVFVRPDYDPYREKPVEFRFMSHEEQAKLIEQDPSYGRIVCRCEQVTEGEIRDVLRSPIVPASVTAIKNRVRAGMGRCQGGFCQPRVIELLAEKLGKDWTDINLRSEGSNILVKDNREEGRP